jgi:hypothetical protein
MGEINDFAHLKLRDKLLLIGALFAGIASGVKGQMQEYTPSKPASTPTYSIRQSIRKKSKSQSETLTGT